MYIEKNDIYWCVKLLLQWWVQINNFPISCIWTTIIWEKPQLFVWITRVYVSTYRVYNWSRTIKQQYVYQKNFLISPRLRGKGNVKSRILPILLWRYQKILLSHFLKIQIFCIYIKTWYSLRCFGDIISFNYHRS